MVNLIHAINKNFSLITICIIITSLCACSNSDEIRELRNQNNNFKVILKISDYTPTPNTRAVIKATGNDVQLDQWSYTNFSDGDELGLYANTNKGRVSNLAMLFSVEQKEGGDIFSFGPADDPNFEVSSITGANIFMYFPYSENMPTEENTALPGLELRTKKAPYTDVTSIDGTWRCIDFLTSEGLDTSMAENGVISGNMVHSFSELIIMRGEGFNKPKVPDGISDDPYKITVKLSNPYTHVKIKMTANPWKCETVLANEENYTLNGQEIDTSIWEAWKGDNYGKTDEDPVGYEAWYVILPTVGNDKSASRSRVEYIQLYDNDGVLQTVKDLYLSGANGYVHHSPGNYLDRKWRYPMTISMQELVPTVFPFTIEPWNNGNITNARTRGITQQNVEKFVSAYNTFIQSNRTTEGDLAQYGDKIQISGGDYYWHFYILETVNLSNYKTNTVIPALQDVIDGKSSSAASPVTIEGLSVPFIGSMTNKYDSLHNLTFEHPFINLSRATTPSGVLVNSLNGGGIDNCTINQGYISVNSSVGMFVGTMENAKITNSKASGVVVGTSSTSSSGYLVGSSNYDNAFTNNNSTVVFSNISNNGN